MGNVILGPEEKSEILDKLKCGLQSTKYVTIRYLSMTMDNKGIDLSDLRSEDPVFIGDFTSILRSIIADPNEVPMIKKEAQSMLDKLGVSTAEEPISDVFIADNRNVIRLNEGEVSEGVISVEERSCLSCGKKVSINFDFCPHCGAKVEKNICPQCKEKTEPSWNNCPYCGFHLGNKLEK
ncbi:MAG: zinc ribbon domain-containing protein [Halobacteriota archaeon]|nr:zinc ribbon domain-containing protein [Halobacteriota archaeon]